jgi:hypothetical protein
MQTTTIQHDLKTGDWIWFNGAAWLVEDTYPTYVRAAKAAPKGDVVSVEVSYKGLADAGALRLN